MRYRLSFIVALVLLAGACGGGAPSPATPTPTGAGTPSASAPAGAAAAGGAVHAGGTAARADSVRESYTAADVVFMRDMIHHHAQALVMADMVGERTNDPAFRILAGRITNAQRDEIRLMREWLLERGLDAPDPQAMSSHQAHAGHAAMDMPGMLAPAQLAQLEAARGDAFERLFLEYMIHHHRGALVMVEELLATGGAQNDAVFRLAADIGAEQESEIERMQSMLHERVFGVPPQD